jgi:flagellar motor switch protein FliN/FliY
MTTSTVNPATLGPVLANALTAAWARRSGTELTLAAGPEPSAVGWTVVLPVSGVATGQWVVWFDAALATTSAQRMLSLDAQPADDVLADVLGKIAAEAAESVASAPDGAGLSIGTPAARKAMPPAGAQAFQLSGADGVACIFAVLSELGNGSAFAGSHAPIESGDSRLDAVLEVDLPLVVRFGRAVMPLRAVAELSPGAVVDMGRSPDEPVELLVGERLIARGEVVIVGGNYGVRITELTSGRRATDLEARP